MFGLAAAFPLRPVVYAAAGAMPTIGLPPWPLPPVGATPTCCVEKFSYPEFIKPYVNRIRLLPLSGTMADRNGRRTGKAWRLSAWQVGFEFTGTATFREGLSKDGNTICRCDCCEFRQEIRKKVWRDNSLVPGFVADAGLVGYNEDDTEFAPDALVKSRHVDGFSVGVPLSLATTAFGISEAELLKTFPELIKVEDGYRKPSDPNEDRRTGSIPRLLAGKRTSSYSPNGCVFSTFDIPFVTVFPGQRVRASFEFRGKIVSAGGDCAGEERVETFQVKLACESTAIGLLGTVSYELSENIWKFGGGFNRPRGSDLNAHVVWVWRTPEISPQLSEADLSAIRREFELAMRTPSTAVR
jgi:hypothetical protein